MREGLAFAIHRAEQEGSRRDGLLVAARLGDFGIDADADGGITDVVDGSGEFENIADAGRGTHRKGSDRHENERLRRLEALFGCDIGNLDAPFDTAARIERVVVVEVFTLDEMERRG